MGGIGKTELLRQLIYLCYQEHLVDRIAVIPYFKSLYESFLNAFPNCRYDSTDDDFDIILRSIESQIEKGQRVLILIDNVDQAQKEEAALQQLLALECSVLITSRSKLLDGFEVYPIKETGIATSCLIFHANYDGTLRGKDGTALRELLQEPLFRHPLTLRLMARAASCNHWTVSYLSEQVRKSLESLSYTEGNCSVNIGQGPLTPARPPSSATSTTVVASTPTPLPPLLACASASRFNRYICQSAHRKVGKKAVG